MNDDLLKYMVEIQKCYSRIEKRMKKLCLENLNENMSFNAVKS